MHLAALHGRTVVVRELRAAGISVGAVSRNGYTTLHYAAVGGHVDVWTPQRAPSRIR
jgi:ankyrin repeat protein